jgi:hypothetical protein
MILEMNVKTQNDLDKYLEILKQGIYSNVSITSKKGNMNLITVLSSISDCPYQGAGSEADWGNFVIPTFSCKANYSQNAYQTYKEFLEFIKTLKVFNLNQILLVSGNPKMKLGTLEVLEQFEDEAIKIGVAYNPYSKDLKTENQRLIAKLKYPNVNQVWLQLGQDLDKLKAAVEFIKNIKPEIKIVNSILLPNKNLLKALQFRPWSGVYYTDQFYNNLDFALQNAEQMQQLSRDLGLEILISGV